MRWRLSQEPIPCRICVCSDEIPYPLIRRRRILQITVDFIVVRNMKPIVGINGDGAVAADLVAGVEGLTGPGAGSVGGVHEVVGRGIAA